MQHLVTECYKVFSNDDSVLTLTYHIVAQILNIQHVISRYVDAYMHENVINQLYHGFAHVRAIMFLIIFF